LAKLESPAFPREISVVLGALIEVGMFKKIVFYIKNNFKTFSQCFKQMRLNMKGVTYLSKISALVSTAVETYC